ncbi:MULTISPECIES: PTS sugar transporter subunit IIA [Staphylococcus]|jgi:PTS system glucose-specific IIA component|uniref:PTS system glucose-specific EIIA component n=1 Tax=Staphylococcus nepalensis TaxID=214473 RepID=A0A2T4SE21_9STAP|nr:MULTISPECIES: PTS glucose transporter subunit IIA [Staphylococcus]VDG67102.1 PTS system IIA component, Glc family [Lacrimispora indolis]MBO1204944.1 PTS glucose transporter subunit IIA [Staphylococcus nepalensis]MBO1213510.1 PTS glucose transporter subunit IIA [Staphylococcus nepalensis]MBO1215268.1 PTS glucose transporter subunit IIA [Staphylococcus nepalensis]MBO1220771.1 PTS glucose transporter subunit IIA [Staphylococcus nepalensis]
MFKKLFGKGKEVNKEIAIYTPITGEYVKIEDIPDPVFAQKMMGEGFGVNPTEGEVVSPINGKVDNIFPTKHAIGLQADNGLELLVHVGLDTVQLDGEGFEVLVESGDTVNIGDPLLRFDLNYIKENAKSVISPIIITNSDNTSAIAVAEDLNSVSKGETKIVDVTMN